MRVLPEALSDARRSKRYGAACDIEVDAIGTDIYPAVLMDISATGLRAMVDGQIAARTPVRVRIGAHPGLEAVVIWQRGTIIGCEFVAALDKPNLLTILRNHVPSSWNDPAVYRGDASAFSE